MPGESRVVTIKNLFTPPGKKKKNKKKKWSG